MYLTGPVYGEEKDVLTGSGKREEKDVGHVFRLDGREGWIEQVQVREKEGCIGQFEVR